MENDRPAISVIVPVYGVEKFIAKCARSLMEQTMTDGVEYIFVDDATKDDSINVLQAVLADYPALQRQVKIVRHEVNKGLPAARNTGLESAKGKYVIQCDSDDYVEPGMLEEMYRKAEEENADIVWSDWFLAYEQGSKYVKEPSYDTCTEALKAVIAGPMKYNVWNKLVRRSLYIDNNIVFPSGYSMGEDMTMMMLFACARQVAYVPEAFYHYVKYNSAAMSNCYTEEHLASLKYNVERVSSFIRQKLGDVVDVELGYMKLGIKQPLLVMSADRKMYRLWQEWFPESNIYVGKNPHTLMRFRILEWCAAKGLFFPIQIYYWVVVRFVYSIKYRKS